MIIGLIGVYCIPTKTSKDKQCKLLIRKTEKIISLFYIFQPRPSAVYILDVFSIFLLFKITYFSNSGNGGLVFKDLVTTAHYYGRVYGDTTEKEDVNGSNPHAENSKEPKYHITESINSPREIFLLAEKMRI